MFVTKVGKFSAITSSHIPSPFLSSLGTLARHLGPPDGLPQVPWGPTTFLQSVLSDADSVVFTPCSEFAGSRFWVLESALQFLE